MWLLLFLLVYGQIRLPTLALSIVRYSKIICQLFARLQLMLCKQEKCLLKLPLFVLSIMFLGIFIFTWYLQNMTGRNNRWTTIDLMHTMYQRQHLYSRAKARHFNSMLFFSLSLSCSITLLDWLIFAMHHSVERHEQKKEGKCVRLKCAKVSTSAILGQKQWKKQQKNK